LKIDPVFAVLAAIMYYHNYLMEYLLIFFFYGNSRNGSHCCGGSAKKNTCFRLGLQLLGLNAVIKEKHDVDANRFLINISGPCANILMFFICIIIKNVLF